jgi:hypothetical protein
MGSKAIVDGSLTLCGKGIAVQFFLMQKPGNTIDRSFQLLAGLAMIKGVIQECRAASGLGRFLCGRQGLYRSFGRIHPFLSKTKSKE